MGNAVDFRRAQNAICGLCTMCTLCLSLSSRSLDRASPMSGASTGGACFDNLVGTCSSSPLVGRISSPPDDRADGLQLRQIPQRSEAVLVIPRQEVMGRERRLLLVGGTGVNAHGLHADAGQRGYFGDPLGAERATVKSGGVGVAVFVLVEEAFGGGRRARSAARSALVRAFVRGRFPLVQGGDDK